MRRAFFVIMAAAAFVLSWQEDCFAQGFSVAKDNETSKYGYKANGIWIIDPEYDWAEEFSEGMAVVRKDGKYGYIDISGRLVIPFRFNEAGTFSSGLAPVRLYGKYGYVNKQGEMAIPFKYDWADSFSEGLAAVRLYGKVAYIGSDDKSIIPFKLDAGKPFEDGIAEVMTDGRIMYMDKVGNIYEDMADAFKSFSGFARHYIEGKVNVWQKKGRYEKTSDWMKRVNEGTRRKLVDSLLQIAQREYIAYMSKSVDGMQTIVDYDADGEIFLIQDSYFGSLLVPVPINEAENFENNFQSARRSPSYAIQNDGLGLRKMTYILPSGRTYKYDNSSDLTFAMADIDYEFDAIDFDVPSGEGAFAGKGNQRITSKNISIGASDVDKNIPVLSRTNDELFAVIVANEDYQREVDVDFALNDGKIFGEYCRKALGIPEENIVLVENATLNDIRMGVDWITKIAEAYDGDAGFIFYYAGHGIPEESTGEAYLLPVDGYGSNVATGYKLEDLYASLSSVPSKCAYVFLDACFSGAERGGSMLASARGVAIKAESTVPKGNLIVFSAAQGDETAYPYKEKGHGMFTYYLLKKIQEAGSEVTLGELSEYVRDEVRKQSIVTNKKMQTPTVIVSPSIRGDWEELKLVHGK